jgi:hypothetical protein
VKTKRDVMMRPSVDYESLGFARVPEVFSSKAGLVVFRCYSNHPHRKIAMTDARGKPVTDDQGKPVWLDTLGSSNLGNCFFVPAVSQTGPALTVNGWRSYKSEWTWVYLESQLNAWFWGNDFERIAAYAMMAGTEYRVGPVGQDTMATKDQRHLPWPNIEPELRQVTLVGGNAGNLSQQLIEVENWPIPGHSHVGQSSKDH